MLLKIRGYSPTSSVSGLGRLKLFAWVCPNVPDSPNNSNLFGFLGGGDAACFAFDAGFGQDAEAALAPGEANADVKQGIGASAGAGKFEDGPDAIGLSGDERHRLTGHMVWVCIYAQHQIVGTNIVSHEALYHKGCDWPTGRRAGARAQFHLAFLIKLYM